MERLSAKIIKEYQEKKKYIITAGEFKRLGLELRNRCGLSDIEAIGILNGKNVIDIMVKYEHENWIEEMVNELDAKIEKERRVLDVCPDKMTKVIAVSYIDAYEECKKLLGKFCG